MTGTLTIDDATLERVKAVGAKFRAAEKAKYAYEPHPKQELFHRSEARVRGLFTGNRFGKTDATVHEAIWWATGTHPFRETPKPPVSIRYYVDGYDGPHLKDVVLPKLRQFCDPKLLGGHFDRVYRRGDRELKWPNGSTIKILSYNLRDYERSTQAYGGAETHLHVFDEHGALEIYREAGARIGPNIRPCIVIAYTPLIGRAAWEYDEIYMRWEAGEPGYECITGTIWDNPHLPREAVEEYLASLPPEERGIREAGVWMQVGGLVYSMFDRDIHFIPFDAARVAASTKTLVIDPHPSRAKGHHLLWCGVDQDQRMFCYREAVIRAPIPEIADAVRRLSREDLALKEDIRRFLIDKAWGWKENESGKSIHEQYREAGLPVEPASGDKTGGIQLMQTALQPAPSTRRAMFEVMDTCPETCKQFERYSWKQQTAAMRESDRWKTIDENDDLVTDARYYVQSDPRFMGARHIHTTVTERPNMFTSPSMRRAAG